MIETLLIANRGEIACRIMRTARRMGVRTIAVYSDADKRALHKALADDSRRIGPAPAADSYLDIEAILGAARDTGADAIHPGYGFLAENAGFARACVEAGLTFVGPPASAMDAMAMKGEAKRLMQEAGVPVLPGLNELALPLAKRDRSRIAGDVGFPLLVKPSAGGGGKGMKIVEEESGLDAALESAAREAEAGFADGRLIVERYLRKPRHIEIQVFADQDGNCIYLGERDCSLQRRHQKIIEESPAPGMTPALREQMGEAAVAAAKAIGYVGAGTVEFLLDENGEFFFMEMNTRLQVEHPVTEMVTGFDLVEWQLRVANGEPLPASQAAVRVDGHAMEARVYAEDPAHDFLPDAGRIEVLRLPDLEGLRIDNGFREGDEVSVFYDPMLMKVIAHASDRQACMSTLASALSALTIGGVKTNRDFLCHALDHPEMQAGRVWTSFLDTETVYRAADPVELHRFAAAAVLYLSDDALPNFRLNAPHCNRVRLYHGEDMLEVDVENEANRWRIGLAGEEVVCRLLEHDDTSVTVDHGGVTRQFPVHRRGSLLVIESGLRTIEFRLMMEAVFEAEEKGSLRSPMSGKVIDVRVEPGQRVAKGEALIVLEAMKMEHTITAPVDGQVTAIHFAIGDIVADGVDLLALEETA